MLPRKATRIELQTEDMHELDALQNQNKSNTSYDEEDEEEDEGMPQQQQNRTNDDISF